MAVTSDIRTLSECLSDFLMNPGVFTAIGVCNSLQFDLSTFNVSLVGEEDKNAKEAVKILNNKFLLAVNELMDKDWKDSYKIKQCSADISRYQCYFPLLVGCGPALTGEPVGIAGKITYNYGQFGSENRPIIEAVHNAFAFIICSGVLRRQSKLKRQEQAQEQRQMVAKREEQYDRTRMPLYVVEGLNLLRRFSLFHSGGASAGSSVSAKIDIRFSLNGDNDSAQDQKSASMQAKRT